MRVVCFTPFALAHVHVPIKMHDALYFLHASSESPESVIGRRGSRWMSSTLGNLLASRSWIVTESHDEEPVSLLDDLSLLSALTWS